MGILRSFPETGLGETIVHVCVGFAFQLIASTQERLLQPSAGTVMYHQDLITWELLPNITAHCSQFGSSTFPFLSQHGVGGMCGIHPHQKILSTYSPPRCPGPPMFIIAPDTTLNLFLGPSLDLQDRFSHHFLTLCAVSRHTLRQEILPPAQATTGSSMPRTAPGN